MTASVLAQLAALKSTPTQELKRRWRELFGTEPPPYNRRFLESRLAYRVQEIAYGGLKPETGTRLIREWQGVEHCVTVRDEGYEYHGRPYQSLSAIARAITGTRWNGPLFFGLRNQRARS
jgi:Protein of unknown function (DUF2924)